MKKSLSIILIVCFVFVCCLISYPQPARADERPLRGVFIDTMYGLGIGAVLGTVITLTDSSAHSDDWSQNLGIGATIGAFVGAAIGFATETRALTYFDGKRMDTRIPVPQIYKTSGSDSSYGVFFNLFDWRY